MLTLPSRKYVKINKSIQIKTIKERFGDYQSMNGKILDHLSASIHSNLTRKYNTPLVDSVVDGHV